LWILLKLFLDFYVILLIILRDWLNFSIFYYSLKIFFQRFIKKFINIFANMFIINYILCVNVEVYDEINNVSADNLFSLSWWTKEHCCKTTASKKILVRLLGHLFRSDTKFDSNSNSMSLLIVGDSIRWVTIEFRLQPYEVSSLMNIKNETFQSKNRIRYQRKDNDFVKTIIILVFAYRNSYGIYF